MIPRSSWLRFFDESDVIICCINLEKEILYNRIERRIDKMFAFGLVDEVNRLGKVSMTAAKAIGINEIKGYLDGEYSLEAARQRLIRNTCLYAKRQLTRFRKDRRINWINVEHNDKVLKIANKVLTCL